MISSGVLIFVLGQFILKILIEPIQELKKEIAAVLSSLVYYADIYSNPGTGTEEKLHEASYALRKHACELASKTAIIPFYDLLYSLRILPDKKQVFDAKSRLIGLSNSVYKSAEEFGYSNSKRAYEIKDALNSYSNPYLINWIIALLIVSFIVFLFKHTIDTAVQIYCDQNHTKMERL